MSDITNYILGLNLLIAMAVLFTGCEEDCEPQYYSSTVPENQKAFIPSNINDTLKFTDENGKKYFLICKSKKSQWGGGSNIGSLNNPCKESSHSWEAIRADFIGNIFSDGNDSIKFSTFIGQVSFFDPYYATSSCSVSSINHLILKFGVGMPVNGNIPAQYVDGYTDDQASVIIKNFHYSADVSLKGKKFQNVNSFSIMNPGPETTCIPKKLPEAGIDSVYYTKQFGLIRFTTIGGKKYQRVL